MRAIAVLSVVLGHAHVPLISGGFTGVDIFFVISGYLIGGHIFSEVRAGNFSFLRFYQRRAKRILPAFYGVLIFTCLVSFFLLSPLESASLGKSALSATLSVSNIFFWHHGGYFAPATDTYPLLMTWSLGVEEQFYAVIPLLLVLLYRIRRSLLLPAILTLCILSFLVAWYELGFYPVNVFYLLPERAWELGVGVLLAVVELVRRPISLPSPLAHLFSAAGLALMFAPIFLLTAKSQFPGPAAMPSVLGTALVIGVPAKWVSRKLLSLPPLVFIGRISYSWYLWHWPILAYLRVASDGMLPAAAAAIAVAASFIAAVVSYHLIEQPFRRSTRSPGPLLIRYASVSVLMLGLCVPLWLSFKMPQRYPELTRIDRMYQMSDANPCVAFGSEMNLSPPCYDASDPRPSVAVWGDSHSAALAFGLRPIANAQGYGFVQAGHAACPPLTGQAPPVPGNRLQARQCAKFNRQALSFFETDKRVRIVVIAGAWPLLLPHEGTWVVSDIDRGRRVSSPEEAMILFRQALAASIQGLQAAGKQVIVMEDVPDFEFDPIMRIRASYIPLRRTLATWMRAQDATDPGFGPRGNLTLVAIANTQLRMTLDAFPDASLIDLNSKLCTSGNECIYRDGNRALYLDYHHLTIDGAHYALRDFQFPALASARK
jgi:peptidoglycan/LPS O-acetylase OafA/YrhL